MKSQKKITLREKAVILYSVLFPDTDREDLFRAAYDGSDEECQKLKAVGSQAYHWLATKKISRFRKTAESIINTVAMSNE